MNGKAAEDATSAKIRAKRHVRNARQATTGTTVYGMKKRRATMKKYCLEVKYVKFITVEDGEDFDETVENEFNKLPLEPCGKCDWELLDCDWEAM